MPRYKPRDDEGTTADTYRRGLWNLFARVKYRAAGIKPRELGQRPEDLAKAAVLLDSALEMCWRAGYRYEQLADEHLKMMRSPKGPSP